MDELSIQEVAGDLRTECLDTEERVRLLKKHGVFQGEQVFEGQHGEMIANIMLSVRHLEDARMRLGKVCQYAGDGVSCLDKK